MLSGQFLQRRGQLLLFYFLEPANDLVALSMLDRAGKYVSKLLQAQWLLRRKENRFQNEFQFHDLRLWRLLVGRLLSRTDFGPSRNRFNGSGGRS